MQRHRRGNWLAVKLARCVAHLANCRRDAVAGDLVWSVRDVNVLRYAGDVDRVLNQNVACLCHARYRRQLDGGEANGGNQACEDARLRGTPLPSSHTLLTPRLIVRDSSRPR